MSNDNRDLLDVLKFELSFLEDGGYGRSVRTPWKAPQIFRDSLSCLNFGDPNRTHPCEECVLMSLVPPERRKEEMPCHHIPLNERGDTVDSGQRWANQQELEGFVRDWLRSTVDRLSQERQKKGEKVGAPPKKGVA